MAINLKKDRRVLKELVNRNFPFSDLSRRFEGVDSSTGNIFCPFHENNTTPSAKMYYNEDKDIFIIHCFKEGKNFTAFDYVERILCKERKNYKDVLQFLESRMSKTEILSQYNIFSKNLESLDDSRMQKKVDYIDNLFNECESTSEYIERLYIG